MICVVHSASVAPMETMGERLRAAREAAGFTSATKAANALGIPPSTYRAHENGQNEYGPEEAEHYGRKFRVNPAYLLTGSGEKRPKSLVESFDPDEIAGGFNSVSWSPHMPGALAEIDVRLGAGEGTIGEIISLPQGTENYAAHRVVAEWVLPDPFLRNELKASPKQTVVMEIIGDSMAPTYQPGDRVLVDLTQKRLVADTVYAISDGYGEPQIKRLQRIPFSDPVRVKIISDNPSLESFEVDLSRLEIIGRICGHIARK